MQIIFLEPFLPRIISHTCRLNLRTRFPFTQPSSQFITLCSIWLYGLIGVTRRIIILPYFLSSGTPCKSLTWSLARAAKLSSFRLEANLSLSLSLLLFLSLLRRAPGVPNFYSRASNSRFLSGEKNLALHTPRKRGPFISFCTV